MTVLVANRGEIALRIIRTARELAIPTVAVYAEDDVTSAHVSAADRAVRLIGSGPGTYLDIPRIVAAAVDTGARHIHPGYGFLAENPEFARACAAAGITFIGPPAQTLELFGDKAAARRAAVACGIPVLPATEPGADAQTIRALVGRHPGGVMIKAVAGGSGRGLRAVGPDDDIDGACRACAGEAESAFGDSRIFAEARMIGAHHIEVQVVGDGTTARAIGDRDCSVQRRHQKLIEIAPATGPTAGLRAALHRSAALLCASVAYRGLATVEFLVRDTTYVFLEVNPRIQVEHTVTEETTGVDLVALQLRLADGATLAEVLPITGVEASDGRVRGEPAVATTVAAQARVNLETITAAGTVIAGAGTLLSFTPPCGPGVRVDTFAAPGLTVGTRYDPLLAKVVVRSTSRSSALAKLDAALSEFVIDGPTTNLDVLRAILTDGEFRSGPVDVDFLSRRRDLLPNVIEPQSPPDDPFDAARMPAGRQVLRATMTGTVVSVAAVGTTIAAGLPVVVLEAMKMEHEQLADGGTRVLRILASPGTTVAAGDPLAIVEADGESGSEAADEGSATVGRRADLDEVLDRHRATRDEAREQAVGQRRAIGRRTARENIAQLIDPGSFVEYGALVLAAQRRRRSEEDLIANTPADGLIGGLATIGANQFAAERSSVVVMSYDYTVLAGTQGWRNHDKTDRLFELAAHRLLPIVLFAEGGGGRPGDTDFDIVAGLNVPTFRSLGGLRGRVPLIAVVSGRCFAGNAALAGTCDVLIATPDANIGMGGPAMISGGGLGDYPPEAIGPIDVQRRNGVVDVVARDEEHAVELARTCLGYFQGDLAEWTAPDDSLSRNVIPENRLRSYDIRAAIESIVDVDSVLELRADWAPGVITALVRVEGRPFGLIANCCRHLGGAIDAEGADKLADFLVLCREHRLPLVSLCDTPGFMVGPEAEKTATVRRFARLFVEGARLDVPFGTVVLRKGYGLGAMAMAGGSFRAPQFTVAWPTGEIGGMGLEGAVRLGYRKELAAAETEQDRARLFDDLVALAYQRGRGLSAATTFELDDVIDPATTRRWIRTLGTEGPRPIGRQQ